MRVTFAGPPIELIDHLLDMTIDNATVNSWEAHMRGLELASARTIRRFKDPDITKAKTNAQMAIESDWSWDDARWDHVERLIEIKCRKLCRRFESFFEGLSFISDAHRKDGNIDIADRLDEIHGLWADTLRAEIMAIDKAVLEIGMEQSRRTPSEKLLHFNEIASEL